MPHSPFDGQQEKTGALTLLLAVNKCFLTLGPLRAARANGPGPESQNQKARPRPVPSMQVG